MKGICYCDSCTGGCSQCVAGLWANQQCCDFYGKHSFANRCTHLRPNDDNHCASFEAQDFGRTLGIVRAEDITPEEGWNAEAEPELLDLSQLLLEEDKIARRSCGSCEWNACGFITSRSLALKAAGAPSLSRQDLWDIGTKCASYVEQK
jgi:hypothetical protein